jgi:hypothetical protein
MFILHIKHTYLPSRPVTEIALIFNTQMIFVPHSKHTYGPPRPVTGIDLLFYADGFRTSQEIHLWASTVSDGKALLFYMPVIHVPQRNHTCWTQRYVTKAALIIPHSFTIVAVFIMCNMSFILCVGLCALLFEHGTLFCVTSVLVLPYFNTTPR